MTNREMLELAAKAAGYYFHGLRVGLDYENCFVSTTNDPDDWFIWDPLTDDGDALRLAVKLELILCVRREGVTDATMRAPRTGMTPYLSFLEQHKDDPYAATRRAIVRAAAEIGRQMEEAK